jgi:ribosomal protein L6P/L9E
VPFQPQDSVINVDNACSWADTLESLISNNFVAVNTFYSYVMSLYSVLGEWLMLFI